MSNSEIPMDYGRRRRADARHLRVLHVVAFLLLLPVVAFSRLSGKTPRRELVGPPEQRRPIIAETNALVLSALGISITA